ncbi:hypothetical protein RSK20926_16232 [Roseobacter sp. SK209-2-6]|nr:hypothetical protein RSK20926_16232 [Roseobacter sp. SK209-2-6]
MSTSFEILSTGWNADPNAPMPAATVQGRSLWLRFHPNSFSNPSRLASGYLYLCFGDCQRYRFTAVNDHGWYLGQCRFSKLAPVWGELYEVAGDILELEDQSAWTMVQAEATPARNFLFYFRDEAFECTASSWSLETAAPSGLTFVEALQNVR